MINKYINKFETLIFIKWGYIEIKQLETDVINNPSCILIQLREDIYVSSRKVTLLITLGLLTVTSYKIFPIRLVEPNIFN